MKLSLAVAAGSACGGVMRYWAGLVAARLLGMAFPWGTLIVNVCGCGLMGFLGTWIVERSAWPPEVRLLLTTGFLGGFTTFSAFGYETMRLFETVDDEKKIRAILPDLRQMMGDGLMTLEKANVLYYRTREEKA